MICGTLTARGVARLSKLAGRGPGGGANGVGGGAKVKTIYQTYLTIYQSHHPPKQQIFWICEHH